MDRPECKTFEGAEETRTFELGHIDLIVVNGVSVGRVTFEPGWRWSECIKPLVGTPSCQATHFGYGISGRLHVRMDDGSEFETGPGEVGFCPPGHDAWVVGDEPYVSIDFDLGKYAKPAD